MSTPKVKTVKPEGDDGPRYYVFEGSEERVPGVTSVLKMKSSEGLIHWAANEAAEFAVRATRSDVPSYVVEPEDNSDPLATSAAHTWRDLCAKHPKYAYDLARKARFRRNKIALDKGNDAHDTIERVAFMSLDELRRAYSAHGSLDLVPWALLAWGQFVKRFDVKVLHAECSIYSRKGYMGTCDLIVEMNTPWLADDNVSRGVVVLDTKTGKGVYPEVAMQLASYRYGDVIVTPNGDDVTYTDVPEAVGAAVFWPTVEPSAKGDHYSLIPVAADEHAYTAFLSLLTVFEWSNTRGTASTALGKAVVGRKSPRVSPPIDWSAEIE